LGGFLNTKFIKFASAARSMMTQLNGWSLVFSEPLFAQDSAGMVSVNEASKGWLGMQDAEWLAVVAASSSDTSEEVRLSPNCCLTLSLFPLLV
jgi:hypothetical protein